MICPPSCSAVCSTSSSRFLLFLLQGGAGEIFLQPLTGHYVRYNVAQDVNVMGVKHMCQLAK
ncbi:hypothetical protein PVAP13_4KG220420 [Panicum virgatum]|uniref:Uncharacterized protein n=1 Tax=Panicum virgatum TaxID=38727 RepID=A0A8T0TJ40_PANVG|nr:hypothetical protein PVAP13_4KG220420 [Panicum virgatum]